MINLIEIHLYLALTHLNRDGESMTRTLQAESWVCLVPSDCPGKSCTSFPTTGDLDVIVRSVVDGD